MKSTWYAATLIFLCRVEGSSDSPVSCFEQIHIINARNGENAYEKSLELGISEEHSYENQEGNTVYWNFAGLSNLEEILDDSLQDGTEICSRRLIVGNPDILIREKEGLSVFLSEKIRNMTADYILKKSSDEK